MSVIVAVESALLSFPTRVESFPFSRALSFDFYERRRGEIDSAAANPGHPLRLNEKK